MALLQRARLESAEACGKTIRFIAHRSAKAEKPSSTASFYGFADCILKLELLARAADGLDYPAAAGKIRTLSSRPDDIPDEKWADFVEAIATRTRQMEDRIREVDRGYGTKPEAAAELRDISRQNRSVPSVHSDR